MTVALLIEDSQVIRRLVNVSLRPSGITVVDAIDGETGLRHIQSDQPVDVVILDIGLPGISGWDVLAAIRSDPTHSELPILVLTAHALDGNEEKARHGGADDFMTKPFKPGELRRRVLDLTNRL